MSFTKQDEKFMRRAIDLAKQAEEKNEVPVGAIIVFEGQIIGEGFNQPILQSDPAAHAEVKALRQAAERQKNYRLPGVTLYVTLEPCVMCAGAMVHARIDRLVFGASDPKTGATGGVVNVFEMPVVNHRVQIDGGLLADECGRLLKEFFKKRRV